MKVFFLCLLCSITFFLPAFASEEIITPSLSTIYDLAKETIEKKIEADSKAKVEITPQNLEGRVNPPRCYPPITAEIASERAISRNNMVKLSCDSPDYDYPWQMYLSVRVEIQYPVVAANQILSPDQIIDQQHLHIMYIDQYSLKGQFFSDINSLIGSRVKRRVAKDSPVLSNNLCFVCKGDTISIYAKTANIEIKTLGEALRDGNLNDVIRVKNSNTSKQFDAVVIGIGEVEVRM
ncbi:MULTISPECIES: flagellar basal body P-ring formation chaperone FlgA [Shewanella]|jgi:flagellar basal body P-ring formation protein FlgA|uniref:flagellar basal body P-ring formation chaperone FlgA n=1 Tax=Shewanella TaxID=22 RepID=UPI000C4860EE|nr:MULTISPECIES: flagellar basal body P-ring formation chaperone FlgA [Shewanella]NCQ45537.1 flagellar basal body P-ring formation protein FlgA [Shewanella frigidimarina]NCO73438.1 flagellar basal body P-ring formation protein FlgA [Shewanella vesiculosa]NCP37585.1 flagellar basal body P-ring formation protein FlgA [Shewanella vesiculosa]NCP69315.1 flagellar basal body P-ring formation protein FlgA [Shewanella vesiculosa]NCP75206.1 flagellar basal body P-ring formation protein FlgA [Shewanella